MVERTEEQKERNRIRNRGDRLRKAAILLTNIGAGHTGLIQETRRRIKGQIVPDPAPTLIECKDE